MIDGYLAPLVVSPQFVPPQEWLWPIVGDRVAWASESSIEGTVRHTLFKRYNEISSTLSGGVKRYAPLFMRTDEEEVLLEDFANGFYFNMSLTMDDWQPFLSDPEIAMSLSLSSGIVKQRQALTHALPLLKPKPPISSRNPGASSLK